jgi:hypothetical protein
MPQVNETLGSLAQAFAATGRHARNILWISTFASLPGCSSLPDPLPRMKADAILSELNGRYVEEYHWDIKERQNRIAKEAIDRIGGSYLEFFNATRLRPGGRRGILDREKNALQNKTIEDCVHWCLPGPLDEISRWLLAYLLTLDLSAKLGE